MKKKFTIVLIVLMLTTAFIYAQCDYALELNDSYGDGWNGANLNAIVNGVTTGYTLASGSQVTYPLTANTGESIVLDLTLAGSYPAEVSFRLLNLAGGVLYETAGTPAIGVHYSDTALCCYSVTAPTLTNLAYSSVDLGWTAGGTEALWNFEYGVAGFIQGTGTTVSGLTSPTYSLTGLSQNTAYDWYVRADCGGGETSYWNGANNFTTTLLCPVPTAPLTSTITINSATIAWTAGGTETLWNLEYGAAGFTQGAGTTVSGLTSPTYSLTGLTAQTSYDWYVQADCGATLGQSTWGSSSFTTSCAISSFPYNESFEDTWVGSPLSPPCWEVLGSSYAWEQYSAYAHTGSNSAYLYAYYAPDNGYLITPPIDLDAAGTGLEISFWTSMYSTSYSADLKVVLSTTDNDPASFTNVIMPATNITGSTWEEHIVNLAAYSGTVYIAFLYEDSGGYQLAIDDVTIDVEPTCPAPSAPVVSNLTAYTADVSWTESGSATSSYLEYGAAGFNPGEGTTIVVYTSPDTTLAGLIADTDYDIYVQSYCGVGDLSTIEGPTSFSTLISCPKPTAPSTTLIGTDFATVGWTPGGTETLWHAEYGLTGFTPDNGEGTIVPPIGALSYNITGLDSDTYYDWYVVADCGVTGDGISVLTGPTTFTTLISCSQPTAGTITNIMPTTADISWTAGGTETLWDLEYGAAGFTQGTGTTVSGLASATYSLTGLTEDTSYDWYVRADCGTTLGLSTWVLQSFSTPCATISSFPYNQGFEDAWVGSPASPPCWEVLGTSYAWEQNSTYAHTGSYSAALYADYAPNNGNLITPPIDLDAAGTGLLISFWTRMYSSSYSADLQVVLSTTDNDPASFTNVIMAPTAITGSDWVEHTFNLSAYSGTVFISFLYEDSGGYYLALDDLTIYVDLYVENPINTFTMNENTSGDIDLDNVFSGGIPPINYTVGGEDHIAVDIVSGIATLTPDTDWYGTEWLYFTATDLNMNTVTDTAKVCVLLRETAVYDFNETGIPLGWGITHNGSTEFPWQKIEDSARSSLGSRSRADSSMMVLNDGFFATSDEWLVTEEFDFTNKDSLSISFWEDFNASGDNEGIFSYSTDGGFGWNPLYNVNTSNTGTVENDIKLLAGESSVKFRWRYLDTGTGTNWWNVDDVILSFVNFEEVSQITTLSVADTGINYVTLSWDSLTIDYFSQYEIYYDTNPSVDTDSNKWSFENDENLKNRGCTSTTVNNLTAEQYYFVIRGIDGFGNVGILSNEVGTNVAFPPVFSSPIPTNQPNPDLDSTRTVTIGLTITDGTGVDQSSIQYRYDQNGNGIYDETWNDYVTRSDRVKSREDVTNVSIEVTYDIDSDNLAFEWQAKDILGSDYTYSGTSNSEGISDDFIVRIDTQSPDFVDDLVCADTTVTTTELNWITLASDAHFMQYEIYYSINQVVTLTDTKWDGNNDVALLDVNTISTIVTGVDNSSDLYFAICAVDSAGNRSNLSSSVVNKMIADPPLCYNPYPINQSVPEWSTSQTVEIGVTFFDYFGIDTSTIQYRYDKNGNGIYDDLGWLDVYAEITLLSDKSPDKNPDADILTKTSSKVPLLQNRDAEEVVLVSVEFDVDGDELHFEFRAKDIDGYGYTYTGTSNSEGILDDYLVRIDANSPADVSNAGTGNPTHNSLDIGWVVSSDDFFDTYQIYYADHETVTETDSLWDKDDDPALTDPAQWSTTITGLSPYTTYYFIIRAIDLAGNTGGFSPEVNGTTIGLYPPLPPQNLQITTSYPDVILNWNPVTEDTNGSTIPVGSYTIYNANFPDFPVNSSYLLTTVNDTTYTHINVLLAGKMFYKVTAIPGAVVRDGSISADVRNYFRDKLFDLRKRKN